MIFRSMSTNTTHLEKQLIVLNEHGLHARPAADFVRVATRFASTIQIRTRGSEHSAKRVMDVLFAKLNFGHAFILVADGPDATEAVAALESLLQRLAAVDQALTKPHLQAVRSPRDFLTD